jgi:hypothetical protein
LFCVGGAGAGPVPGCGTLNVTMRMGYPGYCAVCVEPHGVSNACCVVAASDDQTNHPSNWMYLHTYLHHATTCWWVPWAVAPLVKACWPRACGNCGAEVWNSWAVGTRKVQTVGSGRQEPCLNWLTRFRAVKPSKRGGTDTINCGCSGCTAALVACQCGCFKQPPMWLLQAAT